MEVVGEQLLRLLAAAPAPPPASWGGSLSRKLTSPSPRLAFFLRMPPTRIGAVGLSRGSRLFRMEAGGDSWGEWALDEVLDVATGVPDAKGVPDTKGVGETEDAAAVKRSTRATVSRASAVKRSTRADTSESRRVLRQQTTDKYSSERRK